MRRSLLVVTLSLLAFGASAVQASAASETTAGDRALVRKGAKLWPVYCSRCHQAIPRSAYSPAQWDMIILHMRSRAPLTGQDAEAILKFLQP
jgi:hypothetical protein